MKPIADGLFEMADDGSIALIGGYSATSGLHHFPLGECCPYTGAGDVTAVTLPATGALWAWTAVTTAPPGYDGGVPYGFGVVELDGCGLRVVGRITEADPAALELGQPMRLVAETLGADVTTWAFAPAER